MAKSLPPLAIAGQVDYNFRAVQIAKGGPATIKPLIQLRANSMVAEHMIKNAVGRLRGLYTKSTANIDIWREAVEPLIGQVVSQEQVETYEMASTFGGYEDDLLNAVLRRED